MKLRTQLAFTLTGTIALLLLVTFVVLYPVLRASRVAHMDGFVSRFAAAAAKLPADLLYTLEPRFLVRYDAVGRPTVFTRGFGPVPPALDAVRPGARSPEMVVFEFNGQRFRSTERPTSDGGRLLYAVHQNGLDEQLNSLGRLFFFVFVGALLGAALVACKSCWR